LGIIKLQIASWLQVISTHIYSLPLALQRILENSGVVVNTCCSLENTQL
jgi:hypothetical protein